MLLEAGLKKSDDNKVPRLSFSTQISATFARYERWGKCIGLGFLGFWALFVVVYWQVGGAGGAKDAVAAAKVQAQGVSGTVSEEAFPTETRFLVIGDYGTGDAAQTAVAEGFKRFAATLQPKPAFVLSTGDQIYEHGITSAQDPALETRFEKMYKHPDLQVPWYVTIGNHDCEGSVDAMLEYARQKDSLWYMPRRYYKVDRPVAPKTILRMVVVDACDLVCGHEPRNFRCKEPMNRQSSEGTRRAQYRWIEEVLAAGKPPGVERMWTIVVGHWGVYSYAGNKDTPELIASLDPLLKKYRVHAYFSGHDHCLQHIKHHEDGWTRHFFVSGAGGYRVHDLQPGARANADLVHAAMTHGFMSVKMTQELFRVQLVDKLGEILYTTDVLYE